MSREWSDHGIPLSRSGPNAYVDVYWEPPLLSSRVSQAKTWENLPDRWVTHDENLFQVPETNLRLQENGFKQWVLLLLLDLSDIPDGYALWKTTPKT